MFILPPDALALHVRILTLGQRGEQQLLNEIKAIVPGDANATEIEYLQDSDGSADFSEIKACDFTVIALCANSALDLSQLITSCKNAAAASNFTVLIAPLLPSDCGSQVRRLEQLREISKLVDTLVLVPSTQATVPTEIASCIPLLLSGCSFIGIDIADIKYVLTDAANTEVQANEYFHIAMHEHYAGTDDLQLAAATLAERLNNSAQTPLSSCLASLCFSSSTACKLNDITRAAETIYSGVSPTDSTQVFGAPLLSASNGAADRPSLQCIAGKLTLDLETLLRLEPNSKRAA